MDDLVKFELLAVEKQLFEIQNSKNVVIKQLDVVNPDYEAKYKALNEETDEEKKVELQNQLRAVQSKKKILDKNLEYLTGRENLVTTELNKIKKVVESQVKMQPKKKKEKEKEEEKDKEKEKELEKEKDNEKEKDKEKEKANEIENI